MIEITNKGRSPISLTVKSKRDTSSMTTLNIPGVGRGNNRAFLEDNRITVYVYRVEEAKMITVRKVENIKGE